MNPSSKTYIINNRLNGKIKKIFIKGLIIGFVLSLILSYYKYRNVLYSSIEHTSDNKANNIHIQEIGPVVIQGDEIIEKEKETEIIAKKDILAFVGIQVETM